MSRPGTMQDLWLSIILPRPTAARVDRIKYKSLCGDCMIGGKRVLLMKPSTFMNNSGEAVRDAAAFYKIPPERILVIFDDISLDVGRMRIRRKGTDGGHNGIKSIIYLTGRDDFPRIKLGIGGKPRPDYDLAGLGAEQIHQGGAGSAGGCQ